MPLNLSPSQLAFNARGDGSFKLPFQEQIDFFKQKLNLPTERYDDILKAAHDRAFVVAGAMKADLLNDLKTAIDKVNADGESIGWFQNNFDRIVKDNGWEGWTGSDSKAGRDWRTRIIYRTNVMSSYAAGRYAQLTDPDTLSVLPYWKYIHNDTVLHPRPLHVAWSGTVLKHDDPWWQTHFCPNGWGCRCRIQAVSAKEYKGDKAPDDGTWIKKDRFGNEHIIPNGIDYGWDYAPGANVAKTFKSLVDDKLIRFPAKVGADMWQVLKPVIAKETQAEWSKTLALWMATEQVGRTAVVGAIDPETMTWLQNEQKLIPQTAQIAIREGLIRGTKQARHNANSDGLTLEEWDMLPKIISSPEQILFDTQSGKLLYILSSKDSNIKLSVEFYYIKKGNPTINMIVSGFKQSSAIIAERIKGKLYRIIK